MGNTNLLFTGCSWGNDYSLLQKMYDAVEPLALEWLGLDAYPNELQIISYDQMIEIYASRGMPDVYKHWSFGKAFSRQSELYKKDRIKLAYELVINSNPCISYLMEENSATMQLLVIAHAAFGHNHFFKNNYLFREHTNADMVLDYMRFAKRYVAICEEKYGIEEVERIITAAHSLMSHGVDKIKRKPRISKKEWKRRIRDRLRAKEEQYDVVMDRTIPKENTASEDIRTVDYDTATIRLPEENILYFISKRSPKLKEWQREIIRIVFNTAQYFYPQRQTKMMNEGCATFVHYEILDKLMRNGNIDEGSFLEMLHMHTSVTKQWPAGHPAFSGINPYYLGFEMMRDIKRICINPTSEDKDYFPDIAGCGNWKTVLKDAWANYRDESFILQFLSPNLVRKMELFSLRHEEGADSLDVTNIHNESCFERIRSILSRQYSIAYQVPDIQVVEADLKGRRILRLLHKMNDDRPLLKKDAQKVLFYTQRLWGYKVILDEEDCDGNRKSIWSVDEDGKIGNFK